jgi:amino acid transporter
MYALSFGEYVESIAPGAPIRPIAFLFMTVFYLTNLFGMKSAAIIQKILMIVLLAALFFFVIMGIGNVHLDAFSGQTMFTGGSCRSIDNIYSVAKRQNGDFQKFLMRKRPTGYVNQKTDSREIFTVLSQPPSIPFLWTRWG